MYISWPLEITWPLGVFLSLPALKKLAFITSLAPPELLTMVEKGAVEPTTPLTTLAWTSTLGLRVLTVKT